LLDFEPPVDQKVLEEPSPQKSRRRTEIKFHRDHDQGRMTLLGINCYVGSVNTDQEHSWMAATARRELSNEAEFAVEPEFEFGEDARQLSEPSSRAVRG
jgi:hypothetical protein